MYLISMRNAIYIDSNCHNLGMTEQNYPVSSPLSYSTDILMKSATNRYKMVLKVVRRAKQKREWQNQRDLTEEFNSLHISKPVCETIAEMAQEYSIKDLLDDSQSL